MDKKTLKLCLDDLVNPIGGVEMFANLFMQGRMTCEMPEFHKELYRHIRTYEKLALAAPRSFAKTTVVDVIYPCYLGLLKLPQRDNIAIFSATQGLSVEQLQKIKHEYDTNARLIQMYYEVWGCEPHTPKETWRDDEARLTNGVTFRALGAGGQTRGKRPNVVICDDLEKTDAVRSADQRKNLDEWFRKDVLGLLEPGAQILVIGTILHYASLLKVLINEMCQYGWFTKIWKAYKDGIQEPGYELWPEKWSHEQLQQRKLEQGSTYFSAEYMNEPVDDATAPIKQENIRYWEDLPTNLNMVIAVDPAYSEDSKADFKVASLVGCDMKNNRYLVKYIRTHEPQYAFFNSIVNLWQLNRHAVQAIGIPNQGVEKSFYNAFIKFCEERNLYPPIAELKNVGASSGVGIRNKKDRIIATLQPIFEQGKYFIHASHSEARDELLGIGYTKNDDVVDTMTYAEQIIQPSYDNIVYTNNDDGMYVKRNTQSISNYGMD